MVKRKRALKLGWFGWTFISVILITIIGSSLFFFNVFNLDMKAIIDGEQSTGATAGEEVTEETVQEIEEIQGTLGKEHTEIGQFISDMHDYYNKTTGYGNISNLDWDDQVAKAQNIIETIEVEVESVTNDALITDLKHIQNLANAAIDEQKSEQARQLHRHFHDLDIALNSYNGYDRIWNVTETLKSGN